MIWPQQLLLFLLHKPLGVQPAKGSLKCMVLAQELWVSDKMKFFGLA
jgi:hypothetical protein